MSKSADEPLAGAPAIGSAGISLRWLLQAAARIRMGELAVELPGGPTYRFRGPADGPAAAILFKHARAARRIMFGASDVGFGRSYIEGDWDSPNLVSLLELVQRNFDALRHAFDTAPWLRYWLVLCDGLRANTRWGAKRNIRRHYDLGNEFYAAWLDPSLTYSSGIFPAGSDDLALAQRNKYRLIAERLAPAPGARVLEIGCGWGGLAEYLAREHGAQVTAITISAAQADLARARIQAAGLQERIEIRLQDYRDVPERFDRIVSIEMIEAVGERYWPAYFGRIRDSLASGGRAVVQAIAIADARFEDYRRNSDFIRRYVFPGGMLPSPARLKQEASRAGLIWREAAWYGDHYARTLALWAVRFEQAWPRLAAQGFDERFRRLWRFYLAYCETGFRTQNTDLGQIVLTRG
jgi:cyclopropane-fatty-acyl-phospholipid synthase